MCVPRSGTNFKRDSLSRPHIGDLYHRLTCSLMCTAAMSLTASQSKLQKLRNPRFESHPYRCMNSGIGSSNRPFSQQFCLLGSRQRQVSYDSACLAHGNCKSVLMREFALLIYCQRYCRPTHDGVVVLLGPISVELDQR